MGTKTTTTIVCVAAAAIAGSMLLTRAEARKKRSPKVKVACRLANAPADEKAPIPDSSDPRLEEDVECTMSIDRVPTLPLLAAVATDYPIEGDIEERGKVWHTGSLADPKKPFVVRLRAETDFTGCYNFTIVAVAIDTKGKSVLKKKLKVKQYCPD